MSAHGPAASSLSTPADVRIAVIAARWNASIVDVLLAGCVERLKAIGLKSDQVEVRRAPGAFELPVAARMCVDAKRFDAVIVLGCVIRGETYHFETVANEAARGTQQVAVDSGVPCIFGVLTVNTEAQARDRCGGSHGHAGVAAADAAVEMILLARSLKRS